MVIGICGPKRSGKDSIADVLEDTYGYDRQSLARPMKEALKAIFGWTDEHLDGALKEIVDQRFGISPRQALQHIGTQWGQFGLMSFFPDFMKVTGRKLWVRRLCDNIQQVDSVWAGTVVPDIRFPHEEAEFRERFGEDFILIHVTRPGTGEGDLHESEIYHDKLNATYDIFNDGSLEDLFIAVQDIMDNLG